jgi:hypothetical protein
MKFSNVFRTVTVAAALALAARAFAQDPTPIDSATPSEDGDVTLNWLGDPGEPHAAYVVVGKPSLTDEDMPWERSSGYITPITDWKLNATVSSTNDIMFYRVEKVDREGPEITFLSPKQDWSSVDPDADVSVSIADRSGLLENSLAIYVGGERHGVGDPDVTWTNGVLTYSGGNLGLPGTTNDVWATATDIWSNSASTDPSMLVFANEPETVPVSEPQVVPFLVITNGVNTVSDLVDRVAGETGITSASMAAAKSGGTRSVEATLRIAATTSNTLVFAFTGDACDLLAVGQLWASDDANNIFYRKITGIGERDDSAGTITVETAEATLADFFVGGGFNSDDGAWAEYDVVGYAEGEEATAQSRRRLVRPRVSGSTAKSFTTNGVIKSDWLNDRMKMADVPLEFVGNLGEWDVGAGFSVAADFAVLQRKFRSCDLAVNGNVHVFLHPKFAATTYAAYSNTWSKTIANVKKTFAGTIGPVPVWVDVGVEVPVTLSVQAQATNASVQATIDISRALDFRWRLTDDQWKQVGSGNTGWVIAKTNFTYEVEGSAGVRASIKPTVTVKVYSLIGAYGWVEPYLEADALGRVQGHNLVAPDFYYRMRAYAGLEAEIGLASTIWSDSWGTPPRKTFSPLRKQLFYLEGTNRAPEILTAPVDYTADIGETVMFSVIADGTTPLRYAWYHNGKDTGRREPYITLTAGEATAGNYQVVVGNGYGTNDASALLTVVTNVPVVGAWEFGWTRSDGRNYRYKARIYADGTMHDTSPNDAWWVWHLNGKNIRFETREKRDGRSAVYRGVRHYDNYFSGDFTSLSGQTGTWWMQKLHPDPDDDSVPLPRSIRPANADAEEPEAAETAATAP